MNVGASNLSSSNAILTDYFRAYRALPVLLPQSERPGDVYIDMYHGFLSRSADCFSGIGEREEASVLQAYSFNWRSAPRLKFVVPVHQVIEASVDLGIRINSSIAMSFDEVTVFDVSQWELLDAISASDGACAVRFSELRNIGKLPWILRTVIYAKQSVNLSSSRGIDAAVGVALRDRVTAMTESPEIGIAVSFPRDQNVSLTSSVVFPVAYRPAFISFEHVVRLQDFDRRGVFERFLDWLRSSEDNRDDIIIEILEEFPDITLDPMVISDEATTSSELTLLDPEDEIHAQYLNNLSLLLVVAWEISENLQ
jgi:hypothetical protein